MTTRQRSSLLVLTVAVLLVGVAAPAAHGQSPLEQWAENQISDKTGIDPELLATLFVDSGGSQFILSFVFINEEVMQSNLREDLKESIRPYVGQRAMMALIVPTKSSTFQPTQISFAQNDASFLLSSSSIEPITDGFKSGELPSREVNAAVLKLPQGINLDQAFTIKYGSEFQTSFALQPASGNGGSGNPGRQPVDTGEIRNVLLFLLQMILAFFLFPFLI